MRQQAPWTDHAIVSAIAGGGRDREVALEWWFGQAQLQTWIRHYAVQHGGSETDGEDLYHDTFITFDRLLRTGKYRNEASLKTFFCSIAKWQWLNQQRKKGRVVAMDQADLVHVASFAEDDFYDQERQSVLQQMLLSLGDKCKRVLTLYQLSYSMKEIAAEMGWATDQVAMNQCSECRKKLKALIENSHELKEFLNV